MAMSKKDFEAIARVIKRTLIAAELDDVEEDSFVRQIALKAFTDLLIDDVLAPSNPRFDRDRFMRAAGF